MASFDLAAVIDFVLGGIAVCSLVAGEVMRRWRRAGEVPSAPVNDSGRHGASGNNAGSSRRVGAAAPHDHHSPAG